MIKKPWSAEEEAKLRALFPSTPTQQLTSVFGRSVTAINNKAQLLGIKRTEAFKAAVREQSSIRCKALAEKGTGKQYQFQPGLTPWNKGKKFVHPEGPKKTYFKPGHIPHNHKPIGTVRLNKTGYLEQKTERGWEPYQRVFWEKTHGPVPKGYVVSFKSRVPLTNADDITLDKLELVSKRDILLQNSGQQTPELWRLYQLKGAINRQRNRIIREHHDK